MEVLKVFGVEVKNIDGDFAKYYKLCRLQPLIVSLCALLSLAGLPVGILTACMMNKFVPMSMDTMAMLGLTVFGVIMLIAMILVNKYIKTIQKNNPIITVKNSTLSNAAIIHIGNKFNVLCENRETDELRIQMK